MSSVEAVYAPGPFQSNVYGPVPPAKVKFTAPSFPTFSPVTETLPPKAVGASTSILINCWSQNSPSVRILYKGIEIITIPPRGVNIKRNTL